MMSKAYTYYVNPFQGNGEIAPEIPYAPADSWYMIKGLTGNTTPAAVLPFGKYSCLAYDGAYPSGYGINKLNSGEEIEKLYPEKRFIGLSHFHHSGVGGIKKYYNYALAIPFYGDLPDDSPRVITSECATPGYYRVGIDGIMAETTVSDKIVCHRYQFAGSNSSLFFDFGNNGLYNERTRGDAMGSVTVIDANNILAAMELEGVTIWFRVSCSGATVECLMKDSNKYYDSELALEEGSRIRFGCLLRTGGQVEVRLSASFISAEHAEMLLAGDTRSFDEIRKAAEEIWEQYLSRVEIETDDPREMEIFYSNLYHTLIKPCDYTDESFLTEKSEGDFVADIATMWDIYKTQIPFLCMLYPEISKKFIKTLERIGEEQGFFPHCVLLSDNLHIEATQARMLAEYSICDAYYRGIPADYSKLLELSEIDGARFEDFAEGCAEFASHILDMSEAYHALAVLAEHLGDEGRAKQFAEYGKHFIDAFDHDGLMRKDSPYYEGNRYNYSFRPLSCMKERLEIAGVEKMEQEALRFFGFTHQEDVSSRFEAFNNETDMESPYFLHEIGRRDLLCQVIRAGMDCMFTTGTGGIPGNADGGGLTACYLWNVIGLFPVSGFDRMIVGLPRYRKVTLHMPEGDLVIERCGDGNVTESAYFNERKLDNFEIKASELQKGGSLKVYMK